jgi:hypothetical protein
MDPCNYCDAPMSSDCQACGSAQARARRSISLEYLDQDKRRRPQIGMRHCRSAGYPGDQIKAAGQEGIAESAWVPIVPLWGTPTGDAMTPVCDRGFGPSIGVVLLPARVDSGKGNLVKGAKRRRR